MIDDSIENRIQLQMDKLKPNILSISEKVNILDKLKIRATKYIDISIAESRIRNINYAYINMYCNSWDDPIPYLSLLDKDELIRLAHKTVFKQYIAAGYVVKKINIINWLYKILSGSYNIKCHYIIMWK